MKKIFLVLAMVLVLTGFYAQVGACTTPACDDYAQATATGGTANATIQKGAIQNSNSNLNVNTNVFNAENTFKPVNTNKQNQEQGQAQRQNMNNKQTIAPVQEVNTPQALLPPPSQYVPSLSFGNGRMKDVTKELPNFAIYGIKELAFEPIREVLDVSANIKFKNLYKEVLEISKAIAGRKDFKASETRYQIIRAEAQKSWATGGNLGGAASSLSSTGLSGVSAAGSVVPTWGGTKADDLFTVIIVRVAL
jgi:hypothetical protein